MFAFSSLDFADFPRQTVTWTPKSGAYVDGKWVAISNPSDVTPRIQNARSRDVTQNAPEGRRVLDARYLRFESDPGLALGDSWKFNGATWETISMDVRPARNFVRVLVARFDA